MMLGKQENKDSFKITRKLFLSLEGVNAPTGLLVDYQWIIHSTR